MIWQPVFWLTDPGVICFDRLIPCKTEGIEQATRLGFPSAVRRPCLTSGMQMVAPMVAKGGGMPPTTEATK